MGNNGRDSNGPMVDRWIDENQGEMVPLSLDSSQPHIESVQESPQLHYGARRRGVLAHSTASAQTLHKASDQVRPKTMHIGYLETAMSERIQADALWGSH